MKRSVLFIFFLLLHSFKADAFNLDLKGWKQISGTHFKVIFKDGMTDDVPREILNKAEEYYRSIADRIGYARYQKFWTWDERVPIVLFSSQEEFIKTTGRPLWSKGFAISHLSSINQRMIVTYKDQDDFLKSTLPHEIGHLILHDFIGSKHSIPAWFDEGVAQMEEREWDDQDHRLILSRLIQGGQGVSIVTLQNPSALVQLSSLDASIFYAESLYIVDFLVKTYGKESFVNLCRNLRDGKGFEQALKSSYPSIDSVVALQDKWFQYMRQYQ